MTGPASAQTSVSLPDAPQAKTSPATQQPLEPVQTAAPAGSTQDQNPAQKPDPLAPPAQADPQAASPLVHAPYEKRKWSQYVDPGEKIPALFPEDKWVFWLHEEERPWSLGPAVISAGYGQLTDSPAYGSDAGAFGDRLAAALVRQATMRFFCSSLFPVYTHEDPRYFRKASGSYLGRAGWAAERAFITQRDSGNHSFNFSNIVGHLAASAITPALLPEQEPQRSCGYANLGNLDRRIGRQ